MSTTTSDQQKSTDASVATFTSALIFNGAVTVAVFVAFDILRKRSRKVYEPRTYLVPENKRSEPLPSGLFAWILPVLKVSDEDVIKRTGLDAYMFIRFMKIWMILFSIFSIIGLPILLPVNSVNQGNNFGLDIFTIGNVNDPKRLWSHVVLLWIFSGLSIFVLFREYNTFIRLRHEYHTTSEYRNSPRATTILVTGIPNEINETETLKSLFDVFPGGVKRIWLNRSPVKLAKATAEREKLVNNLEGAATTFIIQHAKDLAKSQSKESDAENGNSPNTKRPQHRDKFLIGKKVDSLETYQAELLELNKEISELQKNPNDFARLSSAFIQFNDYVGAQLAASLTIPKLTNISPEDVVWENLNLTSNQRMIRRLVSLIAVTALVVLWFPLVAFVASISTLSELSKVLRFLEPAVEKLPSKVVGIIQGILPAVGLAILMFLLPVILRFLSSLEGITTHSRIALSVQGKYYFYLVMNVLLITSFAGGIFNSLPQLVKDPTKSVEILATNLPRASTFFLTYVLLTMTSCALELCQAPALILNFIFKKFLAKTPRKRWQLEKSMKFQDWGTGFPPHILIVCIGLVYATVQPLILPVIALHFSLYFLVYRHQFLYVYDRPHQTGGLLFPKGIYQTFTGIYISQLTLIGLMFLNQGFVQGILCVVLLILSIGVLLAMRNIFKHNPKAEFLPVDLMGVIDMKTKLLLVGENISKHQKISSEEQNDDDDYTRPDALHIEEGDQEDLVDDGSKTFTHPALVASQPTVWIPDDQNISDQMVNSLKKESIKATNRGANLDEKHNVTLDIDKIPLEFEDDKYAKQIIASKKEDLKRFKIKINEIEEDIGESS